VQKVFFSFLFLQYEGENISRMRVKSIGEISFDQSARLSPISWIWSFRSVLVWVCDAMFHKKW